MARQKATNVLPSKWVLKWKIVNGKRIVKARLTVQGFRDRNSTECFSGTSARWAQRLLLAVAVERQWTVAAADVSEAFLRGLTFAQVSEDSGQPLRSVQLQLPAGAEEVLKEVPGLRDLDFSTECLDMLKPGYGLKDAPRLWSKRLQQCLLELGLKPLKMDPQTYVAHAGKDLRCLLTVHVDDIKITGALQTIKDVLECLQKSFDKIKVEYDAFEHLGLKHQKVTGGVVISQRRYVEQLKPIPDSLYCHGSLEEPASEQAKELYRSLVGGLAWTVQTRPDIAVFVSALQRRLSDPLHRHCRDANRVLSYMKKKPLDVRIPRIGEPLKLYVISDAAFQGIGQDHLALRSGVIALGPDRPVGGSVRLQVLDTVSKKQSRVCRSTLQAELHSALDLFGHAAVMAHGITEVLTGSRSAHSLAEIFDEGGFAISTELFIDARSVLEAVRPEQVKTADKITAIHILKLAEHLERGQLRSLTWVDTRDMLADGLNKGSVDRQPLRTLCEEGVWHVKFPVVSISRHAPKSSSSLSAKAADTAQHAAA